MNIGLQLYTIREALAGADADRAAQVLHTVADIGYRAVELYGRLDNMTILAEGARRAGLDVVGTVCGVDLFHDIDGVLQLCDRFGLRQMGISGARSRSNTHADSVTDADRRIDEINRIGAQLAAHGVVLAYHNHDFEFERLNENTTFWNRMTERFDENVKFVLDTYWVQRAGGDVRRWIDVLGSRIVTLHLKDMVHINGNVTYAEIGRGNLWWDGILPQAKAAGVRHFVVEQDACAGDPMDSIRISLSYLQSKL